MTRTRFALVSLLFALIFIVVARPAEAQDHPRLDLFGGFSILPANGDDFPRQTSQGIQAGAAVHLNRWFGVFGEVGLHFNTARDLGPSFVGLVAKTKVREYLVGPRFTKRSERADVFVHALYGLSVGDAGEDFAGFSDSGITFGGGGGVDVRVHRRIAVRGQFDYFGSFADIVDVNPRFAIGLVVRLGPHY